MNVTSLETCLNILQFQKRKNVSKKLDAFSYLLYGLCRNDDEWFCCNKNNSNRMLKKKTPTHKPATNFTHSSV